MEALVPPPAIVLEVAVEGENVAGVELVGHVQSGRHRRSRRRVAILGHDDFKNRRNLELKGNLYRAAFQWPKSVSGRSANITQHVDAFSDHRLAGHEWIGNRS